jgi:hypothetical protein
MTIRMTTMTNRILSRGLVVATALFWAASIGAHELDAQTTFTACRVPDVGAIYMIGVSGAPSACLDPSHIEFSWTEGSGALAEGSVTTTEIADGTIATADIGADAVTSAEIADGTIASADIGADAVTSAEIADGTVAASDMAADAIDSPLILDGSITSVDIADASVQTADIQDGAVTKAKLAVGLPVVVTADIGTTSSLGASYADYGSVAVTAPTSGSVFVMSSGLIQITGHSSGSFSSVRVGVTDASATLSSTNATTRLFVSTQDAVSSHEVPYAVHGVFPVSAGAHTFYLIAEEDGASGTGTLYFNNLVAIFIPD